MPYIPADRRKALETDPVPATPGELNYLITELVLRFLGESPRYADFNAAIGALQSAQFELYRRAVSPYEDQAIAKNGDLDGYSQY